MPPKRTILLHIQYYSVHTVYESRFFVWYNLRKRFLRHSEFWTPSVFLSQVFQTTFNDRWLCTYKMHIEACFFWLLLTMSVSDKQKWHFNGTTRLAIHVFLVPPPDHDDTVEAPISMWKWKLSLLDLVSLIYGDWTQGAPAKKGTLLFLLNSVNHQHQDNHRRSPDLSLDEGRVNLHPLSSLFSSTSASAFCSYSGSGFPTKT